LNYDALVTARRGSFAEEACQAIHWSFEEGAAFLTYEEILQSPNFPDYHLTRREELSH
jgi:hypothetical protein